MGCAINNHSRLPRKGHDRGNYILSMWIAAGPLCRKCINNWNKRSCMLSICYAIMRNYRIPTKSCYSDWNRLSIELVEWLVYLLWKKMFSASQDPPEVSQIEYCVNIPNGVWLTFVAHHLL